MVKNVQANAGLKTALVVLGWVAFMLGSIVKYKLPIVATILLAIARVLP
jgi:hypothetical protein